MKIKYDAISHVGAVRSNNEDMALVFGAFLRDDAQRSMVPMKRRPRFTALVADGMGGYGGGEVASEMTLRSFDEFITSLPDGLDRDEVVRAVKDWFAANNNAVLSRQTTAAELARMGTTLTGIFTYGPYEFMLNTGDSRVYRRRYDTLRRLSVDHSERERLNDPSVPSNLIYNAIGIPEAFVDVTCLTDDFPMVDGDTYIICSDGLHDMISDECIDAVLASGGTARTLVDAAIDAGGKDNCTVIMLQVSIPDDYDPHADMEQAALEPDKSVVTDTPSVEPSSYSPVEVPVEAARGFDIDEDLKADNDGPVVTPPPYIPPVPETPAVENQFVEKTVDDSHAVADDSMGERARTAGKLFKEAFNILFKPKSKE